MLQLVVLYPKDTEKWKQFTTYALVHEILEKLFCIPKILKNESNSQLLATWDIYLSSCFVSQRYWKMKAIHNSLIFKFIQIIVVLYPKDTEKWKQFTTSYLVSYRLKTLFCIPKILKNESNSQQPMTLPYPMRCCFVSQRYWKMKSSKGKARRFGVAKAIHNKHCAGFLSVNVVLYPKDTEKWKQFTTK